MARKHLGWYSSGLPNSSEFRATINQAIDVTEVKEKTQKFYESVLEVKL